MNANDTPKSVYIGCRSIRARRLKRWWALAAACVGVCSSNARPAHASVPQYITIINNLQQSAADAVNLTASPIIIRFYNGPTQACFSATLGYGESVYLSTGGLRSPCANPVTAIAATPLVALGRQVCFAPSQPLAIDPAAAVLNILVAPKTSPNFDPATGALLQAGTTQCVRSAS